MDREFAPGSTNSPAGFARQQVRSNHLQAKEERSCS
jgi:hypothetical protein